MRASTIRTPLIRRNNMTTPNSAHSSNDIVIPTPVAPIAPPIPPRAMDNNDDASENDGDYFPVEAGDVETLVDNVGNVDNADTVPREWEGCHGDFMLARLRSIGPNNFGQNDKEFYKSYKIWKTLTGQQKDKAYSWFKKLALPFRSKFLFLIFLV